jgi:hypothetical protein
VTKALLLKDLSTRLSHQEDARVMVESLVVNSNLLVEFLEAPQNEVQKWARDILGNMTFARARDVAVLAVKPCVRLVSLPRCALSVFLKQSTF